MTTEDDMNDVIAVLADAHTAPIDIDADPDEERERFRQESGSLYMRLCAASVDWPDANIDEFKAAGQEWCRVNLDPGDTLPPANWCSQR
jgi:hypothetical protein